ncbi:MAG TPA: hypothetical protein VJY54_05620 [Lachnospiraceae bacterium]|nr:hypothetical protein [Lachnospiraceae bacterium]
MQNKKKAIKYLLGIIFIEMAVVAAITILLDPFYQYHKPSLGLQAVLNDRDNQMMGTIRNFSYDSVILGSSVAENFDSSVLDQKYDAHFLKIIRASGSTADLLYYLEEAHLRQDINRIFWNMDLFALESSTEVTLYSEDTPRYLHTTTILDDFTYLFNKQVLFEKIPLMIAYSFTEKNTDGHAYDWSEDKEFSAAKAMQAYTRPDAPLEPQSYEENKSNIAINIEMVINEINSHPDTEYTVFFPPYSLMWWDNQYMQGTAEEQFYVLGEILPALLSCENVSVYYFQSDREIVCNLDNYMDVVHYTPQMNQYMLDSIFANEYQVTVENMDETIKNMRETYDYIIREGIYLYYER